MAKYVNKVIEVTGLVNTVLSGEGNTYNLSLNTGNPSSFIIKQSNGKFVSFLALGHGKLVKKKTKNGKSDIFYGGVVVLTAV